LPATLQGRVRLSATHLVVLALLVAAALALTGWWVVHAGDRGTFVAPVSSAPQPLVSTAVSASPSPGGPSPPGTVPAAAGSSSPSTTIVVDVAGKVRRPGIATLPSGSRVVDAIEAAGGARRGVTLGSLNLARVLSDGEQVVVGLPPPAGVAASVDSSATVGPTTPMVNINSASQADLEELPGVGPVTAQAILTYRSENGAFTAVDQLLDVSGIGDATLAKIAPFVTL
jgi:competence protein ComEA